MDDFTDFVAPWGPREQVIRISVRVVKGDWNRAVFRNNHKTDSPVSVFGGAH